MYQFQMIKELIETSLKTMQQEDPNGNLVTQEDLKMKVRLLMLKAT